MAKSCVLWLFVGLICFGICDNSTTAGDQTTSIIPSGSTGTDLSTSDTLMTTGSIMTSGSTTADQGTSASVATSGDMSTSESVVTSGSGSTTAYQTSGSIVSSGDMSTSESPATTAQHTSGSIATSGDMSTSGSVMTSGSGSTTAHQTSGSIASSGDMGTSGSPATTAQHTSGSVASSGDMSTSESIMTSGYRGSTTDEQMTSGSTTADHMTTGSSETTTSIADSTSSNIGGTSQSIITTSQFMPMTTGTFGPGRHTFYPSSINVTTGNVTVLGDSISGSLQDLCAIGEMINYCTLQLTLTTNSTNYFFAEFPLELDATLANANFSYSSLINITYGSSSFTGNTSNGLPVKWDFVLVLTKGTVKKQIPVGNTLDSVGGILNKISFPTLISFNSSVKASIQVFTYNANAPLVISGMGISVNVPQPTQTTGRLRMTTGRMRILTTGKKFVNYQEDAGSTLGTAGKIAIGVFVTLGMIIFIVVAAGIFLYRRRSAHHHTLGRRETERVQEIEMRRAKKAPKVEDDEQLVERDVEAAKENKRVGFSEENEVKETRASRSSSASSASSASSKESKNSKKSNGESD